jgi:hypothetical protein
MGTLIDATQPAVAVVVGAGDGRAALEIAELCKQRGLDTEIVCVDTWLAGPRHLKDPGLWAGLRVRHGYPQAFYQFMANVLHAGHSDVVVPLAQTSADAATTLEHAGVEADLVCFDGTRDFQAMIEDLRRYWRILADGGAMFGSDFESSPAVKRASRRFAEEIGRSVLAHGDVFVLTRAAAAPAGFEASMPAAA